jgi:PPK2 family polyphosphate:nucleotide phosphotransferase
MILKDSSTLAPKAMDKSQTKLATAALLEKISKLQNVLYAQGKYSLLIILQGMDASGKDGAIKNVFSGINPLGTKLKAFKTPTEEEAKHDFLWRIHSNTPEKGMIQLFNRSHYEDVLVPKVHKWVSEEVINERYQHINNFESLLQSNDTRILKFYLHISKEEQQIRLKERTENPEKYWKHSAKDKQEAAFWEQYRDAYENIFKKCNEVAKWIIVPADQNWYKDFVIATAVVECLEKLKLEYPPLIT